MSKEEYSKYLSIAVEYNNVDRVKEFLAAGADPNGYEYDLGFSIFEWAVQGGDKEIISLFLQYGVNIDIGEVFASISKHSDSSILELLYNYDNNIINMKNIIWEDALSHSVIKNNLKALQFLITKGGDKNSYAFLSAKERSYKLLDLAYHYERFEIINYLKSIGAESFFKWSLIRNFESNDETLRKVIKDIIFEYERFKYKPFYNFLIDEYDFTEEEINNYFIIEGKNE